MFAAGQVRKGENLLFSISSFNECFNDVLMAIHSRIRGLQRVLSEQETVLLQVILLVLLILVGSSHLCQRMCLEGNQHFVLCLHFFLLSLLLTAAYEPHR